MASKPKAYAPEQGYSHQLLYRYKTREWEHLDYAETYSVRDYLLSEYELAYRGTGGQITSIRLPTRYWDKEKVNADLIKRAEARRERRKQKLNSNGNQKN